MCGGSRSESFIARYELWDLVCRNVIDWFWSRDEATEAVQAYVDVDDANNVMLLEYGDTNNQERTFVGDDLVRWTETTATEV
jgi:hypothetical protein